ncbi:hypothetical protein YASMINEVIRUS_1307 [Yasminevirus sp. GU-2018]|uniref:Uncharacterized protein n=1 Tax=Yasminevirus sp. GU-2018 TaxID=2420051 RepID=A0A5K0UAN6_9VIRU|nr:hypothetical protein YASMINEVIRUS_1307 [Yasminevirus sp. GU-2018]
MDLRDEVNEFTGDDLPSSEHSGDEVSGDGFINVDLNAEPCSSKVSDSKFNDPVTLGSTLNSVGTDGIASTDISDETVILHNVKSFKTCGSLIEFVDYISTETYTIGTDKNVSDLLTSALSDYYSRSTESYKKDAGRILGAQKDNYLPSINLDDETIDRIKMSVVAQCLKIDVSNSPSEQVDPSTAKRSVIFAKDCSIADTDTSSSSGEGNNEYHYHAGFYHMIVNSIQMNQPVFLDHKVIRAYIIDAVRAKVVSLTNVKTKMSTMNLEESDSKTDRTVSTNTPFNNTVRISYDSLNCGNNPVLKKAGSISETIMSSVLHFSGVSFRGLHDEFDDRLVTAYNVDVIIDDDADEWERLTTDVPDLIKPLRDYFSEFILSKIGYSLAQLIRSIPSMRDPIILHNHGLTGDLFKGFSKILTETAKIDLESMPVMTKREIRTGDLDTDTPLRCLYTGVWRTKIVNVSGRSVFDLKGYDSFETILQYEKIEPVEMEMLTDAVSLFAEVENYCRKFRSYNGVIYDDSADQNTWGIYTVSKDFCERVIPYKSWANVLKQQEEFDSSEKLQKTVADLHKVLLDISDIRERVFDGKDPMFNIALCTLNPKLIFSALRAQCKSKFTSPLCTDDSNDDVKTEASDDINEDDKVDDEVNNEVDDEVDDDIVEFYIQGICAVAIKLVAHVSCIQFKNLSTCDSKLSTHHRDTTDSDNAKCFVNTEGGEHPIESALVSDLESDLESDLDSELEIEYVNSMDHAGSCTLCSDTLCDDDPNVRVFGREIVHMAPNIVKRILEDVVDDVAPVLGISSALLKCFVVYGLIDNIKEALNNHISCIDVLRTINDDGVRSVTSLIRTVNLLDTESTPVLVKALILTTVFFRNMVMKEDISTHIHDGLTCENADDQVIKIRTDPDIEKLIKHKMITPADVFNCVLKNRGLIVERNRLECTMSYVRGGVKFDDVSTKDSDERDDKLKNDPLTHSEGKFITRHLPDTKIISNDLVSRLISLQVYVADKKIRKNQSSIISAYSAYSTHSGSDFDFGFGSGTQTDSSLDSSKVVPGVIMFRDLHKNRELVLNILNIITVDFDFLVSIDDGGRFWEGFVFYTFDHVTYIAFLNKYMNKKKSYTVLTSHGEITEDYKVLTMNLIKRLDQMLLLAQLHSHPFVPPNVLDSALRKTVRWFLQHNPDCYDAVTSVSANVRDVAMNGQSPKNIIYVDRFV